MAATPEPSPTARPRVPAHAWTWLQRSRSVLAEIGSQLYGDTVEGPLLERLKADHAEDPFVQDLVARVVCDIAFNGRVPERRPPGARWDRGLTWWAAHLAGLTPAEFEARSTTPSPPQARLFSAPPPPGQSEGGQQGGGQPGGGPTRGGHGDPSRPVPRRRFAGVERRAMVQALKDVLAAGDGHTVPADAVRALLASLEDDQA